MAKDSLKYYKGYQGKSEAEIDAFNAEFERMKSIAQEQKIDDKLRLRDLSEYKFSNKHRSPLGLD